MIDQIRRMMRAPKDDDGGREAMHQLERLHDEGVVRDPAKSGCAYSPAFLSNRWHGREPRFSQHTPRNAEGPECDGFRTIGARRASNESPAWYRLFNRGLTVLADTLRVDGWQLAVKLEAWPSGRRRPGSGGRYRLMAPGEESRHSPKALQPVAEVVF